DLRDIAYQCVTLGYLRVISTYPCVTLSYTTDGKPHFNDWKRSTSEEKGFDGKNLIKEFK
ncbi:MAG: hypothetical protein MI866_19785, partial [Bacteroidales bacterium]|nr:hypothetical protein [Bacteroidales bacterium]